MKPVLCSLHWLPMKYQVIIFKTLNGLDLRYLKDGLTLWDEDYGQQLHSSGTLEFYNKVKLICVGVGSLTAGVPSRGQAWHSSCLSVWCPLLVVALSLWWLLFP